MSNLRHGIDDEPADEMLFVRLDFPHDDRARAITALRDLERVRTAALHPERLFGPVGREVPVLAGWKTGLLVAFGLPFFLGRLGKRPTDPGIPNFPPEGDFPRRVATRFGLSIPAPKYLRTMAAFGDRDWARIRLEEDDRQPTEKEVDAAYLAWLSSGESDLLLILESNNRHLTRDLWDRIRERVVEPHRLFVRAIHDGSNRRDGRDHLGWHDGTGNMQDLIRNEPQRYRSLIYLPRPAPGYPGETILNRDPLEFHGGTYLVYRKYREHIERWQSDQVTVKAPDGRSFVGEAARTRIIGRDRATGRVVERQSGELLTAEYDSTEVNLAPHESHILQARGGAPAVFKAPFPPLTGSDVHEFKVQDIRIRRRGCSYSEIDPRTGHERRGLHFVCFQNNIQQLGFEFIHNIWLMNPNFQTRPDALLRPEHGYVEPLEGAYYFVPPRHAEYPGDVFFRSTGGSHG